MSESEIAAYYAENYDRADRYEFDLEQFPHDNLWALSRGRALVQLLRERGINPSTVCDVGCGFGHMLYPFRRLADELAGVDYDPLAEDALESFGADFLQGGLRDSLGALRGNVDLLLTSHVLEHIIDPNAFLTRCREALAPGGKILFEVPHSSPFHNACEAIHSPHVCFWERDTLRRCLEKNGFQVRFMDYAGKRYRWFNVKVGSRRHPLRRLAKRIYRPAIKRENRAPDPSDPQSIGFALDAYGGRSRRNIRVLAKAH